MLSAIRRALWLLAHLVVPLRYRVRVRGRERLRGLKGPVLLLPNHPGYIDPVLIITYFYYPFRPRPLLYEDNFRSPALRPLVTLLRAVPIPELDRPSREALERTERAVAEVIEGLRRGENFVLWPSGRVQRDGVERLGAARALSDILRAVPDVTIVLVRTRGVWGSLFTYAPGPAPRLGRCFRIGVLWLAANLLFFMPRRRVDITVEPIDRARLPGVGARRGQPMVRGLVQRRRPGAADVRPLPFPLRTADLRIPRRIPVGRGRDPRGSGPPGDASGRRRDPRGPSWAGR